jgi:hypothetical protein
MMYHAGRPDDVIIRTMSAPRHRGREADQGGNHYEALIYSRLSIEVEPPPTSGRYPQELRNLPLRGVERLTIGLHTFSFWLASFIQGDKEMAMMRERLLEVLSPKLRELLTSAPLSMRIWWSNTTPELDELPWELTVEPGRRDGPHQVALFRGLPPETPIPALPLAGNPRLGMIGAWQTWPEWAHSLAQRMGDSVVKIDGPIREALAELVSRGVEFVHVFADGIVSDALEGILYDHAADKDRALIPSGELAQILSRSRVVVLALSPPENVSPDTFLMAGRPVLSAYRAFAYLGTSPRLPTVLAPLGPVSSEMMTRFWTAFYNELATRWHLTESLRRAQAELPYSLPIALFSRHAGGNLFQTQSAMAGDSQQPMEVRANLLRSQAFTSNLSQISREYDLDLPPSVTELLEKEANLQSRLRDELDGAIEQEGEL